MYHLPSTWRRIMAHFLDRAYIFILQLPIVVSVIVDYFRSEHLRISWPHLVYYILVSLAYEVLSLYFFSTTLGKHQWHLRVVSRDPQSKLRLDQVILRVLTSRLSFYFGWSIFALAFFRHNRTHLADWIAQTQVVSSKQRAHRPKIRWVLAIGFIFLFGTEAIKSASMTLNSLSWQKPFVYVKSTEFKKMLEDIEFAAELDYEE